MTPIGLLRLIFSAIFITMLSVTVWASLQEDIFKIPALVTGDPWFIASLFDAYFGFLTFYCWLFYKSSGFGARLVWLVLIVLLGNTAMSAYMLWQLWRIPSNASVAQLLLRADHWQRLQAAIQAPSKALDPSTSYE
ncbi:MAG: DUF1475 family protein [Candidatus Melainabacteria bacterium]|nr:DUF1475 family protein [Candidatus Melainabacteria bacterium]